MTDTAWSPEFIGERYEARRLHGCSLSAGRNEKGYRGNPPWTCSLGGLSDDEARSIFDLLNSERADRILEIRPPIDTVPVHRRTVEARGWGHTQPDARGKAETCAEVMARRLRLLREGTSR